MYNLSPKDIAVYNKLGIDKPLEIGQRINVPLIAGNFSQNEMKAPGEVFVPLYHTVQEKEWLYRISVNHNKVPVETLEKWNSITKDQAKPGMKLIVGYLKVKENNAALATKSNPEPPTATPVQKPAPAVKNISETKKVPAASPAEPIVKEAPVENNRQSQATNTGGYFKTQFDENGKNASGLSGVFRSASGWKDGKYYALMSNVGVGTIVKVNYPQTNKTIYAKVLGDLPDMKESSGLALRISDAAASELGAVNSKFSVEVKY